MKVSLNSLSIVVGMSDNLVMLMEDKDILVAHIEASKENVDSKISDKETEVNKAISEDWKATETRILDEQHHRNRTVVEEIIKTCNTCKDEISKTPPSFYSNLLIVREFRKLRGDDD